MGRVVSGSGDVISYAAEVPGMCRKVASDAGQMLNTTKISRHLERDCPIWGQMQSHC
jgi:hypothetical protein